MKIHGLFLMSIATMMLFSCNNNQDSSHENGKPGGEAALLSISLKGAGNIQGRAAGTPLPDEESTVNDGIIYVFDAGGNVLKKAYFGAGDITGSSGSMEIETTTAATTVSVLLNTGISDSASMAGQPYDVPTKAQLEALTVDLALSNGTGAGTQTADNLIMSGGSIGTIQYSGTPKTADVPVTVSRIVSKVMIDWSFLPNSTFQNKIRLVGAVVLNVPLSSLLFGTTLNWPATKFIEGLPSDTLNNFPDGGYKPAAADMISNVGLLSVSDFTVTPVPANYFYIFENSATYPTIIAIVADYNPNGIDTPTPADNFRKYYPIVINKASTGNQDGSMTTKRNIIYQVKATIMGVGVDNPFNPSDPATLNITVTVADWALIVNVEQTFE